MSKFKPGDRVRVVNSDSGVYDGLVGTIRNYHRFAQLYQVSADGEGLSHYFAESELELVEDAKVNEKLTSASPIDDTLNEMREIFAKKNADYAKDGDTWSNFREASEMLGIEGFGAEEAAQFLICLKLVRLKSLRSNDREPNNESTLDTKRDLAVYASIAFAMARESAQ